MKRRPNHSEAAFRIDLHRPIAIDQLGPGSMQIILDKGQARRIGLRPGFSRFPFRRPMIIGIVAGISGSCRQKEPVIDLHMLKKSELHDRPHRHVFSLGS